jgi:hypothetical protein
MQISRGRQGIFEIPGLFEMAYLPPLLRSSTHDEPPRNLEWPEKCCEADFVPAGRNISDLSGSIAAASLPIDSLVREQYQRRE